MFFISGMIEQINKTTFLNRLNIKEESMKLKIRWLYLPLLPGPLWSRDVVPVRIPSMCSIEQFNHFLRIGTLVIRKHSLLSKLFLSSYLTGPFIMSRVFTNGPEDWGSIPGGVIPKTQKMALDATLLNTQLCKERVKWSNLGNGVAYSLTPRCSNYWKGSLRVTLD